MRPETAALLRKLVGVAIIVGVGFVSCRMLKHWWRSDSSKELEARQDEARKRVGKGLDALFDRMLDDETSIVDLAATFELAADLGGGYDPSDCALGLNAAFEEALGPDVVAFSALGIGPDSRTRLEMTAKITPSGARFQLPHAQESYPGIAMTADLKLLGKKLHVESSPQGMIEFKRFRLASMPFEKMTASDVAGAIMQGTCRDVGYAMLEQWTTWRRPPPQKTDPLEACKEGFGCRESAEELESSDPALAATLYNEACEHDDELACERLGAIASDRAAAAFTLEMACGRELPRACVALGKLATDERTLLAYLRACDLGMPEACSAAAPLLAKTPFARAASVLVDGKPVKTKLGTIFALRWGQWTKWDRGQPTAWVTTQPARLPEGAIVTEFSLDKLPKGITPPPGVESVYAIALDGGDDRCQRCNPSGGGESIYHMRSFDCVCVLAPHP
jgi:hypothetical protein